MSQATILLAEDDAAVRSLACLTLEGAGYEVLGAANAAQALTIAAQHPNAIDLLLSDVVMPDMDGRELARRTRALRPRARVLFISGYYERSVDLALGAGQRFLSKPFTGETLLQQVRAILATPADLVTPTPTPTLRA